MAIGWCGITLEAHWRPTSPLTITNDTYNPAGKSAAFTPLAPSVTDQPLQPAVAEDIVKDTASTDAAAGPSDAALLDSLSNSAIIRVKRGSGGRTLAFKLGFADGSAGYFKPEQQVSSAHWYAELAAYHLDRALGLNRVPPVASRRVAWSMLMSAAGADRRIPELIIGHDGMLRGAVVHWIPEHLLPAHTPPGWENWLRAEPFARWSVSPYQRPAVYGAQLKAVHEAGRRGELAPGRYESVPVSADIDLPPALSDMILFDFLTLNYDRWGGDNTNVLTRGAGGPLIFLDNGDGFSPGPARRSLLDARLAPLSRFRKRTIDALRALDVNAFGERLNRDPLGPILDAHALAGLETRRQIVLEHVAAQARRFGDAVFAW